jgi:S-adenosylmethionine decarboxylase
MTTVNQTNSIDGLHYHHSSTSTTKPNKRNKTKSLSKQHCGLHLTIDGNVSNPSKSFSKETLDRLFKELVKTLEMTIIYGPIFKEVELDINKAQSAEFQDSGGISAFCMISTSHLSLHAFALTGVFQMDVFSCKWFDAEKAIGVIKGILEPSYIEVQQLVRNQPNK